MENQEPTKPTGNLEELFRHHLAEAAVPPRPYVWEQIDNTLLIAQNETYRRRLVATRWVAAASLLLATLAGTGWWARRDFLPATVATTQTTSATKVAQNRAGQADQRVARQSSGAKQPGETLRADLATPSAAPTAGSTGTATAAAVASVKNGGLASAGAAEFNSPIASNATSRAARALLAQGGVARPARPAPPFSTRQNLTAQPTETSSTRSLATIRNAQTLYAAAPAQAGSTLISPADQSGKLSQAALTSSRGTNGAARNARESAVSNPTAPADLALTASSPASAASQTMAAGRNAGMSPLGSVLVSMAPVPAQPLPMPLALQPGVSAEEPVAQARRWRFGLSYTAGLFQSNANFSRTGTASAYDYNPALGANSAALSEAAAAEYRAKQRPGLSHRLRLQAIYRLGGHWNLATGVEVAQQESRSATSYIFTGEQVPDLGQPLEGGLQQEATARYRTAGLPLELRYANPVKPGFSLYGRVGAVVSALLNTRTDVAQEPEATRTYTLLSGSTPYRRVMGALRGAAGIQFRPAGHDYTLSLGPVAEAGLWSMNRHPAQDFLSQSRPYSFGLEAGVEFGRTSKPGKL